MAEITSEMIKDLRERTQAGMLDCKKALTECGGDMEKAADFLRKKGLAAANKRSGREAKEGIVLMKLSSDGKKATLLEMNCETDFVARNDGFKKLADEALQEISSDDSIKSSENLTPKLQEMVKNAIATTGENMGIGRIFKIEIESGKNGLIASYIHSNNKIGVMVELGAKSTDAVAKAETVELGKELAMQVAAANPQWVRDADVPEDVKSREKDIYRDQMKDSGKPANVIEKIIEGKLKKYFSDVCLLDQVYIKDSAKTISDVIKEYSKKIGEDVSVVKFVRLQIGA